MGSMSNIFERIAILFKDLQCIDEYNLNRLAIVRYTDDQVVNAPTDVKAIKESSQAGLSRLRHLLAMLVAQDWSICFPLGNF